MYMFLPFPLHNIVIQKLRATQEGEVILIDPWWSSQPWFLHLLRLYVDTLSVLLRSVLSQQGWKFISDGKSYHVHAWKIACGPRRILIDPWWSSQPWFLHLLRLYVDTLSVLLRSVLSQQGWKFISDGKSYHVHAWKIACGPRRRSCDDFILLGYCLTFFMLFAVLFLLKLNFPSPLLKKKRGSKGPP